MKSFKYLVLRSKGRYYSSYYGTLNTLYLIPTTLYICSYFRQDNTPLMRILAGKLLVGLFREFI